MIENPYQAPLATEDLFPASPESAETIRQAHIKHEASIKSIGLLYYLGAVVIAFSWVVTLMKALQVKDNPSELGAQIGALILLTILAVVQVMTAHGIRRLKPWSRVAALILCVIGVIGMPVGAIISLYVLYILLAKKGRMIFSPEYREIIAATPHVKYQTSRAVWIIIGGLVLVAIAVIAIAVFVL